MININGIEDNLSTPLINYLNLKQDEGVITTVPQIWEKEQILRADEQDITKPRIVYKVSLPYKINNRTEIKKSNVVTNNEDGFANDIEYVYGINLEINVSFTGYGSIDKPVREALLLVREWFEVKQLADRWFQQYNGVIVRNQISSVQDRSTDVTGEEDQRLGFDALIRFEDEIKVREKTIETVEITQNSITESIDT